MSVKGIIKIAATTFERVAQASEKSATNAIKSGASILKGSTPLKTDIVELSAAAATRWTKPAEEYIPNVVRGAKGCAVPMHHDLNGDNFIIRSTIKDIRLNSLTEREKLYLDLTLPEIYRTDKAFSKLIPLEKDVIGYRGRTVHPFISRFNEDFEIVKRAKVGDIIIPDEAYSYWGFEEGLARNWAPYRCENPTIMYKALIPKGARVSRNLEHGGEIVTPRGTPYRVVSKEVKGNHTDITMEYLLPEKDNLSEIISFMKKYNISISKE